ncbi:EcsC family protein [Pontibacter akesuensis]|uniref:EcsC protein family protein n=1 Tax=Pontibacter akesuensis TaxID=388950 RepID=A0A1I7GDI5_9BACT|nr:EcsC family protein [Pontibacter akesuensis]GHA57398.1 ABC transporter-associated protein EcsC [Pontibacter akesuensis]SFU46478.1 EcsC protein family protein [Pontibacter akesuensis]
MPTPYEQQVLNELQLWQHEMQRPPSFFNNLARKTQHKINSYIPEKIHKAITTAIKQMIRGVLFGAGKITAKPLPDAPLQLRESLVRERIKYYQHAAAAEGGVTGAGGFLLGLADFPLLLSLKLKLLFDVASLYGFDVHDYRERVYLLHIFQLAFSSHEHRHDIYREMADWESQKQVLPEDINEFNWRTFQQEYRDYIDLAKMAQLIPIIGAPVGAVVNYRLLKKLGTTAMNAYRMRWRVQGQLQA